MTIGALRHGDIGLMLRVVWVLARLAVLRPGLPLPKLVRRFDASGSAIHSLDLERTARLTTQLVRRLYARRSCMQKSLVLFNLLTRASYEVTFHVGVATRQKELVGHAWLILDGRPFAEKNDPTARFRTIFAYPSRPRA